MAKSCFPGIEFELVPHPDVAYADRFSLIRATIFPNDEDPKDLATEIRAEVCDQCNRAGVVRTCMGLMCSDGEGLSARISNERGQASTNCVLLADNIDTFAPIRRVIITKSRLY